MIHTMDDEQLLTALAVIRDRGAIGEQSLERAVRHADQFVELLPHDTQTLADLGSGGGLPGLVIAARRPDIRVVLIERRATRADQLRRAVSRLAFDTTEVIAGDVEIVARAVSDGDRPPFDVVTARSFGTPLVTVGWARALLRPGGLCLVSEPPTDDLSRWPTEMLAEVGMDDGGRVGGLRRLTKTSDG